MVTRLLDQLSIYTELESLIQNFPFFNSLHSFKCSVGINS